MKIAKNTVVSLSYDLYAGAPQSEKMLVEATQAEDPLTFLFGSGQLLPLFESNIEGLITGNAFEFGIPCDEAYGPVHMNAIVPIPSEAFKVNDQLRTDMLEVGKVLPMVDKEGNRMDGKIVRIMEKEIIMDFNHPLAGKDLHFKGKIVEVRAATAEEIDHGHVHGPGGHHH
jgi:FKBP-type peptidyl-prolyl cis-trans isomerase SlyD